MTGQQDRLDLVPTSELLAALSRRFDACIVAYFTTLGRTANGGIVGRSDGYVWGHRAIARMLAGCLMTGLGPETETAQ
jgi:hypothetical protein